MQNLPWNTPLFLVFLPHPEPLLRLKKENLRFYGKWKVSLDTLSLRCQHQEPSASHQWCDYSSIHSEKQNWQKKQQDATWSCYKMQSVKNKRVVSKPRNCTTSVTSWLPNCHSKPKYLTLQIFSKSSWWRSELILLTGTWLRWWSKTHEKPFATWQFTYSQCDIWRHQEFEDPVEFRSNWIAWIRCTMLNFYKAIPAVQKLLNSVTCLHLITRQDQICAI